MFRLLKQILGLNSKVNYKNLVEQGGQLIDVRTPKEFASGHIAKSVNIPLNELKSNLTKIQKDKPVIVFCRSGVRSAQAKSTLKSNGYPEVYNGRGWESLQQKIY